MATSSARPVAGSILKETSGSSCAEIMRAPQSNGGPKNQRRPAVKERSQRDGISALAARSRRRGGMRALLPARRRLQLAQAADALARARPLPALLFIASCPRPAPPAQQSAPAPA